MPKKRTSVKRRSLKLPFLIMLLISVGMVVAIASYVKAGHEFVPSYEKRDTPADQGLTHSLYTRTNRSHRESSPAQTAESEAGPFVFKPALQDGKLSFQKESVSVPDDEDPKVYVINQFLDVANISDIKEARLLSVDVHDGVASLFFNGEMDHTMGTDDEATVLNGILTNLGQFPEIKSALFYAQGKQIETFGNVDLTEKQPVIRPGSDSTPSSG